MKKEMLINVLQPEEIRIAIIEDGVLEELYVERTSHESYVGNIYKGRIVNIEPSIQAAFVDFGVGRNGFLHVSDVEPTYYRHLEQGRDRDRGERGDRDRGGRGGDRGGDRDRGRGGRGERDGGRRSGGGGGGRGRGGRREEPRYEERPPLEIPSLDDDEDNRIHLEEAATVADFAEGNIDDIPALPPIEAANDLANELAPAPFENEELPEPPVEGGEGADAKPEAEGEEGGEERRPRRRGRGRGRGRRKAGPKDGAEPTGEAQPGEGPPPEVQPEIPPRDDGPFPMTSAERRTGDDDDPSRPPLQSGPSFSDEELSFSMPPPTGEMRAEREQRAQEPPPSYQEESPEPFHEDHFQEMPSPEPADHHGHLPQDQEYDSEPPVPRRQYDDRPDGRRNNRGDDRRGGRNDRERGGRDRGGRGGPRGPSTMARPKPLIQDIFKRGQEVLVQVIKEGIGTKGPTLSTYISIAGRYLVLMPGLNRIGVSRKIDDEESRRRLREILHDLKPPRGLGFIIRTAGFDRNKNELQRDLAYLSRLWQVVVRRITKLKGKGPSEIYQESDMIIRTIRDIFTSEIDTIWVDEKNAFEHAKEFLDFVMPRYANRIKLFENNEPMFHKYGIESEISRIQQKHVPLPMGGSIVIEQTEALVAIDVNSGNFRADNNAEETAYQMNLQAAKEICRQLRLRDLGGVIVNDFIDMRDERHRRGVERAMRDAIARDRARTKVLRISPFGIIEMTRQRIRPSLKRSVFQDCTHCRGSGQVKTNESMSIDVMRLLQLAAHRETIQRIEIRVNEDVAYYLLNRKRAEVAKLEEAGGKQIFIKASAGVSPEFLEFLCLDNNNNEVKFLPYEEPARPPRRRH